MVLAWGSFDLLPHLLFRDVLVLKGFERMYHTHLFHFDKTFILCYLFADAAVVLSRTSRLAPLF